MTKVVKEWTIGAGGMGMMYTKAAEITAEPQIVVTCRDYHTTSKCTHIFPADFIRPVLDNWASCNALLYPYFAIPGAEREMRRGIHIINLFFYGEHKREYKLEPEYDEKEGVYTWKEKEC